MVRRAWRRSLWSVHRGRDDMPGQQGGLGEVERGGCRGQGILAGSSAHQVLELPAREEEGHVRSPGGQGDASGDQGESWRSEEEGEWLETPGRVAAAFGDLEREEEKGCRGDDAEEEGV